MHVLIGGLAPAVLTYIVVKLVTIPQRTLYWCPEHTSNFDKEAIYG